MQKIINHISIFFLKKTFFKINSFKNSIKNLLNKLSKLESCFMLNRIKIVLIILKNIRLCSVTVV